MGYMEDTLSVWKSLPCFDRLKTVDSYAARTLWDILNILRNLWVYLARNIARVVKRNEKQCLPGTLRITLAPFASCIKLHTSLVMNWRYHVLGISHHSWILSRKLPVNTYLNSLKFHPGCVSFNFTNFAAKQPACFINVQLINKFH